MAKPENKPLEVTVDPDKMTLGEMACLSGGFSLVAFRNFLLAHSNWTAEEIDSITRSELKDIFTQVVEQVDAILLPLVKSKP